MGGRTFARSEVVLVDFRERGSEASGNGFRSPGDPDSVSWAPDSKHVYAVAELDADIVLFDGLVPAK